MTDPRLVVRRVLDRTCRCTAGLRRTGSRPLVLGALLLAASTATVLATANTPPTIVSASVSPAVLNEGQSATLRVTFADPDAADLHTVRVKWHDQGTAPHEAEVVQLPAGQSSFTLTHTFKDSVKGPSGSQLQVTVYDRQSRPGAPNDNVEGAGQAVVFVPIQVNNVAPSYVPGSVTMRQKVGRQVSVAGDIVDPGTGDSLQVAATWSDPFVPGATACSLSKNRHFQCEHTYPASLPPGHYPIILIARDDDGGETRYQVIVQLP